MATADPTTGCAAGHVAGLLRSMLVALLLGGIALVVGAGMWLIWFLDLNEHKPLIQQLLYDNLGVEFALNGKLGHQFGDGGLRLSAVDITAAGADGPIADIEQLQLDLALLPMVRGELLIVRIQARAKRLRLQWDADGVFNLLPAFTADNKSGIGKDSSVSELKTPGWLRLLRIQRIEVEIGDGRYQDPEFGLDLRMKASEIAVGPLSIIDSGRLVADTPALFTGYSNRWAIKAKSLRFWGMAGRGVDLLVDNQLGTLSVSRLNVAGLDLSGFGVAGQPADDSGVTLSGVKLGTRLLLDYGVPAEQLWHMDWQSLQRLELEALRFSARQLSIGVGEDGVRLDGLELSTPRLSLGTLLSFSAAPKGTRSGRSNQLNMLAGLLPDGLSLEGEALVLGTAQLANFVLSVSVGKTIGIKLAKGRVFVDGSGLRGWSDRLSAHLRGEAQLTAQLGASLVPQRLDLEQLQLQVSDAAIGAPGDRYRVAKLKLKAAAVPIVRDANWLDVSQASALTEPFGALRLSVAAENISHDSEADHIDALSLLVEGRDRSLLLKSARFQFADTVLTGSGELVLSGRHPPWTLFLDSSGVSLRELAELTDLPLIPEGELAVDLALRGTGFDRQHLTHTVSGSLNMSSDGMQLLNLDLDKLLTHLQYTQHGNLLDISLLLLTGPAGSLIMAASDLSDTVATAKAQGSSRILALRSEVHFNQGVLQVNEAALSTDNHRLAIQGSLSVDDDGPVDLTVATIDRNGCTLFREKITGTLAEPKISNGGALAKVLVQPLKTLVSVMLPGRRCIKPFYTGSVPAAVEK